VVSDLLSDLKREGKTVIVATHDLDRLQADFDDALFLLDGRVIGRGLADYQQKADAVLNGRLRVTA